MSVLRWLYYYSHCTLSRHFRVLFKSHPKSHFLWQQFPAVCNTCAFEFVVCLFVVSLLSCKDVCCRKCSVTSCLTSWIAQLNHWPVLMLMLLNTYTLTHKVTEETTQQELLWCNYFLFDVKNYSNSMRWKAFCSLSQELALFTSPPAHHLLYLLFAIILCVFLSYIFRHSVSHASFN